MLSIKKSVLQPLALALIAAAIIILPAFGAIGVGDKAPDFQLGSTDGKTVVALSSFTDKPTVLVFWASWCPHCQSELPVLQKVYDEFKSKGVNVVGVSVDRSMSDAGGFIKSRSITFPNAYAGTDKARQTLGAYGVKGIPAVYVIDKGGIVRAHHSGEVSASTIKADLAKLGVE